MKWWKVFDSNSLPQVTELCRQCLHNSPQPGHAPKLVVTADEVLVLETKHRPEGSGRWDGSFNLAARLRQASTWVSHSHEAPPRASQRACVVECLRPVYSVTSSESTPA